MSSHLTETRKQNFPARRVTKPFPRNNMESAQGNAMEGQAQKMPSAVDLSAIDTADLHTILTNMQVISSVLDVSRLLETTCDMVLRMCGGSASLVAIVIRAGTQAPAPDSDSDSDSGPVNWSVAASGSYGKGSTAHHPPLSLASIELVVQHTVSHCIKSREPVSVTDLTNDQQFGNMGEAVQSDSTNRAVIAIPIRPGPNSVNDPLLGALYVEGKPGSLGPRNLTMLQLLAGQIGISYSNAMAVEQNLAIVDAQRTALEEAREAETAARNGQQQAE